MIGTRCSAGCNGSNPRFSRSLYFISKTAAEEKYLDNLHKLLYNRRCHTDRNAFLSVQGGGER